MINKANVELLKADLRANARRYDQSTYGEVDDECGTVGCLAGFCLMRAVGDAAYGWLVKSGDIDEFARTAGEEFLGVGTSFKSIDRSIFDPGDWWPRDLAERYAAAEDAQDRAAMVEVACDALDRLQDDGTIAGLVV